MQYFGCGRLLTFSQLFRESARGQGSGTGWLLMAWRPGSKMERIDKFRRIKKCSLYKQADYGI
jgi:hypothetical protein